MALLSCDGIGYNYVVAFVVKNFLTLQLCIPVPKSSTSRCHFQIHLILLQHHNFFSAILTSTVLILYLLFRSYPSKEICEPQMQYDTILLRAQQFLWLNANGKK